MTENIDINDKQIKVVLKQYGAILQYRSITNGAFGFIDKEGSKEINKYISIDEVKYDTKITDFAMGNLKEYVL